MGAQYLQAGPGRLPRAQGCSEDDPKARRLVQYLPPGQRYDRAGYMTANLVGFLHELRVLIGPPTMQVDAAPGLLGRPCPAALTPN